MKKIVISKPCSENWGQMAPTEKGAFCSQCSHEVIDFTAHSTDEIREILWARREERTCGRFEKSQLDLINQGLHPWQNDTLQALQSKFLYACLIVFGMSLFTACETGTEKDIPLEQQTESDDSERVRTMGMIDITENQPDSNCAEQVDTVNTGEYSFTTAVKGYIDYE